MISQTVIHKDFDDRMEMATWLSGLVGAEIAIDPELSGYVESVSSISYAFLPAELGYPPGHIMCSVVLELAEAYDPEAV